MSSPNESPLSERELTIVRETHLSPEQVFAAWTTPELMVQWFCPRPWFVADVEIDVRAGGASQMTICGPDGERFPNHGVYLEVIPNQKLVFTDAFTADWEPNPQKMFVGILTFEELPEGGTRYTAKARHWTRESCENHAAMGFIEGWNKAFDQLVEMYEEK
ncbi:MAG: SRPBCC family protein [Verrucomicrobiae bacterium]|nr:SRPBCC family protein [Verrucomicrobiae bacterium]